MGVGFVGRVEIFEVDLLIGGRGVGLGVVSEGHGRAACIKL